MVHKIAEGIPNARSPICPLCNELVKLRSSKTDELGQAVHEECYVPNLTSKHPAAQVLARHSLNKSAEESK